MAARILLVLALVAVSAAQRPGSSLGPVTPAAPGRPVAPRPKAPVYASESSINFNWGYITVRAGCCLRDITQCERTVAECNDQADQGTWREALAMWSTAGDTWVETCTDGRTQPMAAGCKPVDAPFQSYGARYVPPANSWVQFWLKNTTDYFSVNSLYENSLLDVRSKMWLHQSVFQFMDGFLYVAGNGAIGLNETRIYMEDTTANPMGAATIGAGAKIGCVKSALVLNNSIMGWDSGKIWLIQSSYKHYGGAFIVENTSFWFESSQMSFWDMQQGHVANTIWNLTNSQLNLVRSTIRVWDSTIILKGSHINLNESRLLLSNTQVIGDNTAFSTVNVSDTFGVSIGTRLDWMTLDFKVEAEDGKIVLKEDPNATVTPTNGK